MEDTPGKSRITSRARVRTRFPQGGDSGSKRASPAPAEAAAGKSSATSAAEAGAARTGARRGDKYLVHVRRHTMHRTGEEDRIEAGIAVGRDIPSRRIFYDSSERLSPVVLHT